MPKQTELCVPKGGVCLHPILSESIAMKLNVVCVCVCARAHGVRACVCPCYVSQQFHSVSKESVERKMSSFIKQDSQSGSEEVTAKRQNIVDTNLCHVWGG